MQQAVAGVLSGRISISLSIVEPLVVFANAVGVSHTMCMLCVSAIMVVPVNAVPDLCFQLLG